jgi:hypothetical protein
MTCVMMMVVVVVATAHNAIHTRAHAQRPWGECTVACS